MTDLLKHQTVRSFIRHLGGDKHAVQNAQKSVPADLSQFPELILLNRFSDSAPVFWFHEGFGDVQVYRAIARKSERPFYGIAPKGFMTDRSPLHGIRAMASYYLHIIQSVQPQGPYDIGGYSLGGLISYEVARQLQESGREVSSIVMIDSPYCEELKSVHLSDKQRMLMFVNWQLRALSSQQSEKLHEKLIHHSELDSDANENAFLQQLISIAKGKGLPLSEKQLTSVVLNYINVSKAYDIRRFSVTPLPEANDITCYYFRNKNRLFWGNTGSNLNVKGKSPLDNKDYWSEWEKQLPNLIVMDVDVSGHFEMLFEPKSLETISGFCEALYSEKGLSRKILRSFYADTLKKHGKTKGGSESNPDIVISYAPISSSRMKISATHFSEEELMNKACVQTGLSDWGDDSFKEPLQILSESYKNEGRLNTTGQLFVQEVLAHCLRNRLMIHDELKKHPEIEQEKIKKPLIIVSLPRTGTTFLQRLLANDPSNRSPLAWELSRPAPAVEKNRQKTDPRIALSGKGSETIASIMPELKSMHKSDAMAPEECFLFHKNSLKTPTFQHEAAIPGYMEWLNTQDMTPVYEYQLLQLKILQFQYPTNRWVLKSPFHMYALDALISAFPDACIVQILRDPQTSVPSFNSLINELRSPYSDDSDLIDSRAELNFIKLMTDRYIKARDFADPARFYDMQYEKFVKDPVSEVRKLYEYFDFKFDLAFEKQMLKYLQENPKNKYGKHNYSLEQFGLTKDMIYSHLKAFYKRFGLPEPYKS